MSLEMVLEMMLGCPRVPVPHGFFLVAKRLEGEELCVMEPTGGFSCERVYHVVCLLLVKRHRWWSFWDGAGWGYWAGGLKTTRAGLLLSVTMRLHEEIGSQRDVLRSSISCYPASSQTAKASKPHPEHVSLPLRYHPAWSPPQSTDVADSDSGGSGDVGQKIERF